MGEYSIGVFTMSNIRTCIVQNIHSGIFFSILEPTHKHRIEHNL